MAKVKQLTLASDNERKTADYRLPPYNIEAEQLVLGILLTNNENINRIADFLAADNFFEPLHQRIYSAIQNFVDRGLVATPVTLKTQFDNDSALSDIGGAGYLGKLASLAIGVLNIESYAKMIMDLSIRRKLIDVGTEMVNDAYEEKSDESAHARLEKSEHKLFLLASEGEIEKSLQPLKTSLAESIKRAEAALKNRDAISGVPTGLRDLDKLLGGMHNSDLIILAARPSMGKTALAVNIAVNAAEFFLESYNAHKDEETKPKAPFSVGLFSLEMSAEQIATRILSMHTKIPSGDIRRGKINKDSDLQALIQANRELYLLPFFTDETPAISISALRTRARRLKRKNNLGLIVIDYLQLIRGVGDQGKSNRVQEVSEITQGLKAIAKELNVPVMALSQLSRQVETREDKRPQLADLRESGTIEQDADIVMFIYREEYYKEREKPREGTDEKSQEKMQKRQEEMNLVHNIAEIMVAKHRNGGIGNIELRFDKNTTVFSDLDREHSGY